MKEEVINSSGLQIDDLIYVEERAWRDDCQEIGLIKGFRMTYEEKLEIVYNVLKKNMQESKLPEKVAYLEGVSYFLSSSERDTIKKLSNISKVQQLKLFKKDTKKNYKFKKTRRSK